MKPEFIPALIPALIPAFVPVCVPGYPNILKANMFQFIKTLNMTLYLWFENMKDTVKVTTRLVKPGTSGTLYYMPFQSSFKEAHVTTGKPDTFDRIILEKYENGAYIEMVINMKNHAPGQFKIWFEFYFHSVDGETHQLNVTSSEDGDHFVQKVNRNDDDTGVDDNIQNIDDDVIEDENDDDSVVSDDDEYDDYRCFCECNGVNPSCLDDEDDDSDDSDDDENDEHQYLRKCTKHRSCSDDEDDMGAKDTKNDNKTFIPPVPPIPSHIAEVNRTNRWNKKQQELVIPRTPAKIETIWSEYDKKMLWLKLLELRKQMDLKCSRGYDVACSHLIWRYFSEKTLFGTGHFLPTETKCCVHAGFQLVETSMCVDPWLYEHRHDSFVEFIENTEKFFREKGML